MTKARSNAVANAAKGDLTVGNGTDLSGILAVGSNGETLVADSSTSTGLRYTAGNPIPNPVLNSSFQIAQRGTSITVNNAGIYTLDRWFGTTPNNSTFSQQVTNDDTNLPSIQYCMRVQRTVAATSTSTITAYQSFETVNSIPFAGKTVTLSFYARKGANYSATSDRLSVYLITGTGTDQNYSVAYTGAAYPINDATATLTTTWQRFTFTGTLAAATNEMTVWFGHVPVGTAGANDYYEITGVQVDIGSVALPFRTNGATIQGELAACQRYFQRIAEGATSGSNIEFVTSLQAYGTQNAIGPYTPIVQLRTTPTLTVSAAANFAVTNAGASFFACTALTMSSLSSARHQRLDATIATTSLVAGNVSILAANSSAATLDLSAEL